MKQLFNKPHYSTNSALCWSEVNNNLLTYSVFKRLGNYYWSVFFVILLSGLISTNTVSAASTPYWEIRGNKELCEGDGYQTYTAYTKKYSNKEKYEWKFEKNDCGAQIIGSKYGRSVKVHPGKKAGSYKLICVITQNKSKSYCYLPVYCRAKIKVDAGKDIYSCGTDKVRLWGTIYGADKGYWVGGKGSFSGGRHDLRTYYTPTEQEVYQGYVKLKLVAKDKYGKDYYSKCGKNYDEVVIYISKPVYVKAGSPQEFCGRPDKVYLDGEIKGCKDGGYWSKTDYASGNIYNTDYYKATAIYKPVQADLDRGYAKLKLNAKCYSKCGNNEDYVIIYFRKPATVNPGGPYATCGTAPITLAGTVGGSASSGTWSVVTAGGGSFNGNVFTASDAFGNAGTDVVVRFTSNDPAGPCLPVSQDVTITIDQPVTVSAGPDQKVCVFPYTRVQLDGTITGGATTGTWTTSGTGTFEPSATTIDAKYNPSIADVVAGKVILTLTSDDPAGVCGPQSDAVELKLFYPYFAKCGHPGHKHNDNDEYCDNDKDDEKICSHHNKYKLYCKYDGHKGGKWSHNGKGRLEEEGREGDLFVVSYVADESELGENAAEVEITFTPNEEDEASFSNDRGPRCVIPWKYKIHCRRDRDCGHCNLEATGVTTNVSCNAGTTGAINLSVTGGRAPYTFAWSNGATTEDISGLTAGNYSVKVTDKYGCTDYESFTITEPAVISLSAVADNVRCFGAGDGAINLTVAGGTAPYTYSWTRNGNSFATTEDLTDLAIGTYAVTVTDANGCTNTASYTITRPDKLELEANIRKITVDPYGNIDRKGAIDLIVKGGTAPYTYKWFYDGERIATTEDLQGLRKPGYYRVVVIDANGCKIVCRFLVKVRPIKPCGCDDDRDESKVTGEPDSEGTEETVPTSAARLATKADQASIADEGDQKLSVYPNEMQDRSTIEFKLEKSSPYVLNLYDHTGRLIKQISSGNAKAGEVRKFTIDGTGLKSGIYHGRLITPTESRFTRILKK